jgi:hypothetical protein
VEQASNHFHRHGNDGPWSTFTVKIGTPGQVVHLLPVPYRSALVAISPGGCPNDHLLVNCSNARGGIFDQTNSDTWSNVNSATWTPAELNFDSPSRNGGRNWGGKNWTWSSSTTTTNILPPAATVAVTVPNTFGVDTVKSLEDRRPQWSVPVQGMVAYSPMDPYVGLLGLETNYNSTAVNPTSFFDNVRSQAQVKSVSFSYTAGSFSGMFFSKIHRSTGRPRKW